jgi:hypothetical protein
MTVAHNTLSVDGKVQAEATGKLLEWIPLPGVAMIRLDAGPAYPGITLERTILLTPEYALDSFHAAAADQTPHRYDWLYHNFGALSAALTLEPYANLPRENGYQHLTGARSTVTSGTWSVAFEQKAANLRVQMLGADGTEVVAGEGLGPDLRVPVPFVMARRTASSTRFVTLLEPYRGAPAVDQFTTGTVAMGQTRDEYSFTPFSLVRTAQAKPVRVILSGGSKDQWLDNRTASAVEADWSADGKTLDLYGASGPLRVYAPHAVVIRRNGVAAPATRDGDDVTLQ